jgi:hypothetical protein
LGYSLRPGYGLAVDDWRVAETWRMVRGNLAHHTAATRNESWILWRRIAGGLSAGQQRAVADPLLGPLRGLHRRLTNGKGRGGEFGFRPQESTEMWRLLGSLELLDVETKVDLGQMLLDLLSKRSMQSVRSAATWAMGRLGARSPVYGPLNTVVPAGVAADWLRTLTESGCVDDAVTLAVMQMARRTDDRFRDVPDPLRSAAIDWLSAHDAPPHYMELVRVGGQLDAEEQGRVFGEALPKGLRIR